MTTRKNKPVNLMDAEFQHMHVLGPILWAIVAYGGAGVLDMLAIPAWQVAGAGAVVSLLAPFVAFYKRFAFLLMAATTGLLTWTSATTPWQRNPVLAAVLGGIVFGMSYQALRTREIKVDANKQAEKAASKGRYVELLETVKVKGLKEAGREPFAAGKTVRLTLPVDGSVTLQTLTDKLPALEIAAARAGLACTFEFERGDNAAEVKLHVFDRDVLAETTPLPFERGPKSIHEPIPLGHYATGELCVVTYREIAALMVGLRGQGKSTLINTHLAHLTGCTDAVVWMLDGKSGETVMPWLQPFLDMVTDRPVINWAATTEAEFDAVLLGADAVWRYRSANRLPGPNASRPAVIVIVEEASVITGTTRFGRSSRIQLAQDGVVLGRSSYVEWLFATQRATLDMLGSGSMKTNLKTRYGMGVQDVQEGRMVFPNADAARALARLDDRDEYRGSFLLQNKGDRRVMPVKGFWTDPDTIPSIATSNAQWCAELDRETADHVHETLLQAGVPGGYHGRWDRVCETLGRPVPARFAGVSPTPEIVSRPTETPYDGSRGKQAVQDAVERSRAKREAETFQSLMESAGFTQGSETVDPGTEVPETAPPILRHIIRIMQALGASQLPSRVICDELPGEMTPKALGRLMGLCNVSGTEVIWDGKRARGYTLDDVETAVKRASWTQGAFDWRP